MKPSVAMTLTRMWTRAYTLGLPSDVRAARCAEIESDLWESLHDPDVRHPQILPRLTGGVVDDVCWRATHMAEESRTMWLTVATACLLMVAMWEWLARPAIMALFLESVWFYPVVQSAHVLGIALFVGFTVILDMRVLGFGFRRVPASELAAQLVPWVAPFAIAALITGMLLFLADPSRYTVNPFFQLKAVAVGLAIVNLLVFHVGVYSRVHEWDDASKAPRAARISAALSLILWAVVLAAGRLIAYNWFQ